MSCTHRVHLIACDTRPCCCRYSTCASTEAGALVCWGNKLGATGWSSPYPSIQPNITWPSPTPLPLPGAIDPNAFSVGSFTGDASRCLLHLLVKTVEKCNNSRSTTHCRLRRHYLKQQPVLLGRRQLQPTRWLLQRCCALCSAGHAAAWCSSGKSRCMPPPLPPPLLIPHLPPLPLPPPPLPPSFCSRRWVNTRVRRRQLRRPVLLGQQRLLPACLHPQLHNEHKPPPAAAAHQIRSGTIRLRCSHRQQPLHVCTYNRKIPLLLGRQ
jgi:hypothetical protein